MTPVDAIRREVDAIGGREFHRRVPQQRSHDEITRLASTMNRMLDRVESNHLAQEKFVAGIFSHELRTPLTRLRAELEIALLDPGQHGAADNNRKPPRR